MRAYYRKLELDRRLSNQELLSGIYGCDINPFPAHLATLNLAARNISDEENYPQVVRTNFFTVAPGKTFCELPSASRDRQGRRERESIQLPPLDAVIGNPPYVRHEHIPKAAEKGTIEDQSKEHIYLTAEQSWHFTHLFLARCHPISQRGRMVRFPHQFQLAGRALRLSLAAVAAPELSHCGDHRERGRAVV
ncbi:MAG: hypothetical protein DMG24_19800 [Acidobacteria bacterium]|nr:MAG: hypothetical protein DMG24_19800 [Acidobacteriota bacterium]